MTAVSPPIVAGRSCGECTLCCKLIGVTELDKPKGIWCKHCDVGVGCKIYANRPAECRAFHCGYLVNDRLGEHWKPSRSKMVVTTDGPSVTIYVDPGRPGAWRVEPFQSELKHLAQQAMRDNAQILVQQGKNTIVILPDGEKNIGVLSDDQAVVTAESAGPSGAQFEAKSLDQPAVSDLPRPATPSASPRSSAADSEERVKSERMTEQPGPSFAAGDRVALLRDRGGLKRGMLGTVTERQTIRGGVSVSPDPSGQVVFVVFDNVIGMIPTPVNELEKAEG